MVHILSTFQLLITVSKGFFIPFFYSVILLGESNIGFIYLSCLKKLQLCLGTLPFGMITEVFVGALRCLPVER